MAPQENGSSMSLVDGSRVGVIGGGPAGTFFAYFLMDMTARAGVDVQVDVFEPRDFSRVGPTSCNMCGGIVSESLVQSLAAEGIILPSSVVQRGIDSYVLHMDVGDVRIDTPLGEKRIAAVHRGAGPRDVKEVKWGSFDNHLLSLAVEKGATRIRDRVDGVRWEDGRPVLETRGGLSTRYDLVAVAAGVNTGTLRMFQGLGIGFKPPRTAKTYIQELFLGHQMIDVHLGNSMHVFLLDIPRLEFAALVPKGEYVTLCLLGRGIDEALIERFLNAPEVKRCLPPNWITPERFCRCNPKINVDAVSRPYGDRVVFIGDSGVTRLYKDGIGAAYRTAKAAARTAVFEGVSRDDFRRHYWPTCRAISSDNRIGKLVFASTGLMQRIRIARGGIFRTVSREQQLSDDPRRMSSALWDIFTGSATYGNVLVRMFHPALLVRLVGNVITTLVRPGLRQNLEESKMGTGDLGKTYRDGELIVNEGESGECMYVIQEGKVEVLQKNEEAEVRLAVLGEGDFFGEMALFQREVRSASVRALGDVRVLTVDKKAFLKRICEDPSLALRIVETMSQRIRDLDEEMVRLKTDEGAA
jgi:flavin-dependent dehydrogenase